MNLDYELELMKTAQMQASELNGGASTRADVTAELHHHSRPSGGTIWQRVSSLFSFTSDAADQHQSLTHPLTSGQSGTCWPVQITGWLDSWVSQARTGWRKDVWATLWSWKNVCYVCITSLYLNFLSVFFSVCLKLPLVNTHTATVSPPTSFFYHLLFSFIWPVFYLEAYHMLTRECTEKNRKGKKTPFSVFPTSVECHRRVFFSHHLHLKPESTLGM